jgi:LacI family transcriptional regulator
MNVTSSIKRSSKRPTIEDVARQSGLSKTTVSKVMNVPANELDVPESTRQRVLEAARSLDYRPSWRARALRGGRTQTLAMVHSGMAPAFSELWHRMFTRVAQVCLESSYHVQLVSAPPEEDTWRQMLMEQRFDGCMIFQELSLELSETLAEANLPAVLINARDDAYPSVEPDDVRGATLLTRHLLELGHRRIAFLNAPAPEVNPRHRSVAARISGYEHAMTAAGLQDNILSLTAPPPDALSHFAAMPAPPTAVITYNERVAFPLLNACWTRQIGVPADLSVATFNDVMVTRHSIPPLTTIDVPVEELAERAAEMLLKQVQKTPGTPRAWTSAEHVVLPERLIVRKSTASPKS